MSKVRYIYRRSRKSSTANAPVQSKQQSSAFFDFGGEHSFFSGKTSEAPVNRKCSSCEKEDKVQKTESTPSAKAVSQGASSRIKSLQGGNSLPDTTRSFFEPKFAADFSDVKVHNDAPANELASSVNAKAFTYKNNIVFNKGQYDTESSSGKHLLAHELTHIKQQNPGVSKKEGVKKEDEKVQRTPSTEDFGIKGKDPESVADDSIIRFDKGQTAVTDVEVGKIKRQAKAHKKTEINLNGFTSEEGNTAENSRVVNARINQVNSLLASAGHQGVRHKKPDMTAGEGNANYRSRRVVEIKPTFVAPGVLSVSDIDPCTTKSVPCGTGFLSIVSLSMQKVINSIMALSILNPATNAHLNTFFGTTPAATLIANLSTLLGELITLTSAHNPTTDCNKDTCDDTCSKGAAAYVNPGVTPAKMIFCENLLKAGEEQRSETFIHEALHATPGLFTKDIAYAHTRKMLTMTDAEKLKNTDSYVMLIRMLHDPSASPTAPPNDTISGSVNGIEEDFAKKTIAFMEQWLISAKFTSGSLYSKVHEATGTPAGWESPEGWYHFTMRELSPIFGLTHPGPSAPFKVPTKDDKIRLAGIGDRYFRMREVLHSAPITLNKNSTGAENWTKELGNKVDVSSAFFSKTPADAVKHLILLMLKSMSDVPSSLRALYVQGADKIRAGHSIGP